MEQLSATMTIVFAAVLAAYTGLLLLVGFLARRHVDNVDDFVVAGRSLPLSFSTLTIVATWFGAESLMTTADEVAARGIRGAVLDPFGISLCLILAGLLVAGPLYRRKLLTVSDFFRVRYGRAAEYSSAAILIPSYFGWIAAQYLALGTLFEQLFGIPAVWGVVGVACIATAYSLMGGMWSIAWTDAIQMGFIIFGLCVLAGQLLGELGAGSMLGGFVAVSNRTQPSFLRLTDPGQHLAGILSTLSVLLIGSLGNLPVQDLMQRICSSASAGIARNSCFLAALVYALMGGMPILAGLSAPLLLQHVPEEGVLTELAGVLLSPPLMLIFVLAIVSAVLSTIVSAVLAPASVLGQNLVTPAIRYAFGSETAAQYALHAQRGSVILIVVGSVWMATSGDSAYELVESSYALSFVGLCAAFLLGLHFSSAPGSAALASMVLGVGLWLMHAIYGWESFLQGWLGTAIPLPFIGTVVPNPAHELMDALFSVLAYCIIWAIHQLVSIAKRPASAG